MKALIKISLLALFSSTALLSLPASEAFAGSTGVTPPDSGGVNVGDSLAPSSGGADAQIIAAQISAGISRELSNIRAAGVVRSVNGRSLPISEAEVSAIAAALSTAGSGAAGGSASAEQLIAVLQDQLGNEFGGGLEIDITVLENTPENLGPARTAANRVVLSLDSAQLAAAIESPTFMAILQLLGAAIDAVEDDVDVTVIVEEGGDGLGLPLMVLSGES